MKLVYGFGINDVKGDATKTSEYSHIYYKWKNMLRRCYSTTYIEKHKTYSNVIVSDEWKYYSNFKKWYLENFIDGYELDKDIISGFIYSPETCAFVPHEVNTCILDNPNSKSNLPICVSYMSNEKRNKRYHSHISKNNIRISLGYYNTAYEAHYVWQCEKKKYIEELIEKYKFSLSTKIIDGLQYRVSMLYDDILNKRVTKSLNKISKIL